MNLHNIPTGPTPVPLWNMDALHDLGDLFGTLSEIWVENDRVLGLWSNNEEAKFIIHCPEYDSPYSYEMDRSVDRFTPTHEWFISHQATLEHR